MFITHYLQRIHGGIRVNPVGQDSRKCNFIAIWAASSSRVYRTFCAFLVLEIVLFDIQVEVLTVILKINVQIPRKIIISQLMLSVCCIKHTTVKKNVYCMHNYYSYFSIITIWSRVKLFDYYHIGDLHTHRVGWNACIYIACIYHFVCFTI